MTRLEELIDTAAYPLHHAEGRAALVAAARRSLAEGGFVRLPGFVLPAAVQAMAREAERACAAGGFRRDYQLGAYGGQGKPDLPEDHPTRRRHPYSMHVVKRNRKAP